ncbi:MAG: ATP-dependent RNA helicase [Pirellula sp.]|nr:ATP-dependent RNA helicase [Pirellula sp.]
MSDSISEQDSGTTFQELNLSAPLLAALETKGYTSATPIQARTIPPLLDGRDVLGQAQTGTGKTAAFALPLLHRLDPAKRTPQILVLAPTRELAIQVAKSFETYAANLPGVRVAAIYGGQDYQVQFRELDRGVQVVVGTPGRVMDHMRRGSLKLDTLQAIVLDEADEMLQMGFAEDVDWVLTQAPAERQIALFSATMPDSIRQIAQRHLRNPIEITIKRGASAAETVRQRFLVVAPPQKQLALSRVLEAEAIDGAIVFVKTKSTTEYLAEYLSTQGHRVAALSSDVVQKQRERIVEALKAGRIDVIVATDVAARGLDVPRISHVINYDFPFDSESYVHRIGRTGRAGREGNAILFLNTRERHLVRRIENATRQQMEPMELPTKRAINQRRVARFHEQITANMAHKEIGTFTSIIEQYRNATQTPIEQIAAALVAMAAGDKPLLLTEELQVPDFREPKSMRDAGGVRRFEDDRRGERSNDRGDRGPRRERGPGADRSAPMETFRIEVGRTHQVKPGNIVGAIANEACLDSSGIGRIEIFDDYSTVDLLVGMPQATFEALQQTMVAGRPLSISRLGQNAPAGEARPKKKFAPKFADKAGFDKGDGKPAGKFKKPKRATAKS